METKSVNLGTEVNKLEDVLGLKKLTRLSDTSVLYNVPLRIAFKFKAKPDSFSYTSNHAPNQEENLHVLLEVKDKYLGKKVESLTSRNHKTKKLITNLNLL